MRRITAVFTLACFIVLAAGAVEKPVRGTPFTVSYDAAAKKILKDAPQITLVYVFDVWGTSAIQKMRGEQGSNADLFQNVLYPDPGGVMKTSMTRHGKLWKATIDIPEQAHLLSYYFTDSTVSDYNGKKTYVEYVRNPDGTPVRNARLTNVDFLLMAGRDDRAVIEELRKETRQYPDNFLAHLVYWRFRFFSTAGPDTMTALVKESDAYFAKLQKQYGDTVLNYQVRCLNDVNRVIGQSMRARWDDPPVARLRHDVNTKIIALIDAIPPAMKLPRLDATKETAKSMLMSMNEITERQREAAKQSDAMMKVLVGKPAPDFTFTTLDGASHHLSDFKGRYVLLDFWGTWCGPCVAEIPNLVKIHEKYAPKGLVLLSVSSDAMMKRADKTKLTDFTRTKGMKWMQVLDEAPGVIHNQYQIQFWPNMFLIDPHGTVQQRDKLRGEELEKTLSMLPLN